MTDKPPSVSEAAQDVPRREKPWGAGLVTLWFEAWPVVVLTAVFWLVCLGQIVGGFLGFEDQIFDLGALWRPGIEQGHWWTLFTHMFLHASWFQTLGFAHIVMNSYAFIVLGPAIAQRFGRDALGGLLFLAFFLLCGLAGGVTFLLLAPEQAAAVGASGAIFGLWGAAARLAGPGQARLAPLFSGNVLRQAGSALVSNLIVMLGAGAAGMGIAWQAHLGGFVAGLLLIQVTPVRFHWLRGLPKGSRAF